MKLKASQYLAIAFGLLSFCDLVLAIIATNLGLTVIYLLLSFYFAYRAQQLWGKDAL